MPNFSRKTVLAVTDWLGEHKTHSDIDRFLLEYGLEGVTGMGSSKQARTNEIARYLLAHPEQLDEDKRNLTDAIVENVVWQAIGRCTTYSGYDYEEFGERFGPLLHSLERDGYSVEDGQLRRTLPEALDLPRADDEVHALLDAYGFGVPKGHLDQAIDDHSRGNWAAANSQIRPFIESLLDEIAAKLAGPSTPLPAPGHQRRQWLAQSNPPFFIGSLNEWTNDGKGFIEAFYRRLHPQGSHPGLSDDDDSTFRLHLVLLVARLLLRRLSQRVQP